MKHPVTVPCWTLLATSFLVPAAHGAQPSAPEPVAAPIRDLPWGQLNFLATTDTHGWHAGHLQEAQYSGDWGDYISFATHMRQHADELGLDILLVDTGDRVDGNGLYDGSSPKGKYTYDIFKEQHIDIICTGNHELYEADAAEREYIKTVPNFKGKYLASNLDIISPKSGERVPLAPRYRKFTTKNQGIRVVAFGFLFDFTGNANNTFVQPVEETIKEQWFQEAIREDVDIFVVIGHVDLRSPEYKAIYTAIRNQNWDTPIQFFGGHSHIRNFVSYDPNAYALESGRYMETIGWLAIEGISSGGKNSKELRASAKTTYKRRYIDNNLYGFYHHTGLNKSTFPTDLGKNVSEIIRRARKALDLDERFGCASQDYYLNRAEYPSNNSILSLLDTQVLPDVITGENRSDIPRLAIINSGGIRFDIFKGPFTKDTVYIVCPFSNGFEYIRDVPYTAAKNLLTLLNNGGPLFDTSNLQSWALAPPEQRAIKGNMHADAHVHEHEHYRHPSLQNPLSLQNGNEPALIPGYTTKDDAGDDGDDTLHSPISFYSVPNCIQAEIAFPEDRNPEKVDLVFLSFIRPWVLLGMRFLGQAYNTTDVHSYLENESFTSLFEKWIRKHWSYEC